MAAFPETDHEFRQRIMRVAAEKDFPGVQIALARELDALGRKYGRFRYGVPLNETKKPDGSASR